MEKVIFLASDHTGVDLKSFIYRKLKILGCEVFDCGCDRGDDSVDYPDYVMPVVQNLLNSTSNLGVLICGTGIGMSIAANRYTQIRAALCNNIALAELARQHNDANVLCMGARFLTEEEAEEIVRVFLKTDFKAGRHSRRVKKIDKLLENK